MLTPAFREALLQGFLESIPTTVAAG